MASQPEFKLLRADRLLDGRGGPPLAGAAVLIEDGRIRSIGRSADLRGPEGASVRTVDYPGATILPGLVDAHTHMVSPGDGAVGDDVAAEPDEILLRRAAKNARAVLNAGVTTARENGAKGRVALALRDGIWRGLLAGPDLVICGRPLAITGGHLSYFGSAADRVEAARATVRRLLAEGADWIKITATGGSTRTSDWRRASFTILELRSIVDTAAAAGRLTGAHCTSSQGVVNCLDAGVAMIIHCMFYEPDGTYRYRADLVDQIVTRGHWVNPTLYNGLDPEIERAARLVARGDPTGEHRRTHEALRRQRDELFEAAGRMIQAGARMVAGSDTPWAWARAAGQTREIACLGEAGLTNGQAIAAGTSLAAVAIGEADRAGVLEPGRAADLLVVEGDPLADLAALEHVRAVWQAGRPVILVEPR